MTSPQSFEEWWARVLATFPEHETLSKTATMLLNETKHTSSHAWQAAQQSLLSTPEMRLQKAKAEILDEFMERLRQAFLDSGKGEYPVTDFANGYIVAKEKLEKLKQEIEG